MPSAWPATRPPPSASTRAAWSRPVPAMLVLSGDSTLCGPTLVDGGLLSVDGSLLSAVEVNAGGTLGGSGRIGGLLAAPAARWPRATPSAPWRSPGTCASNPARPTRWSFRKAPATRSSPAARRASRTAMSPLAMENSPDLLNDPGRAWSAAATTSSTPPAASTGASTRYCRTTCSSAAPWTTRPTPSAWISDATARPSPASRRRPARRRSLVPWKRSAPATRSTKACSCRKTPQPPNGRATIVRKSTRRSPACCSTTAAICVTASANACARPATARPARGSRRLVQDARFLGQERRWQPRQRRLPAFGRQLLLGVDSQVASDTRARPGGRLQQQLAEHGQQPAIPPPASTATTSAPTSAGNCSNGA